MSSSLLSKAAALNWGLISSKSAPAMQAVIQGVKFKYEELGRQAIEVKQAEQVINWDKYKREISDLQMVQELENEVKNFKPAETPLDEVYRKLDQAAQEMEEKYKAMSASIEEEVEDLSIQLDNFSNAPPTEEWTAETRAMLFIERKELEKELRSLPFDQTDYEDGEKFPTPLEVDFVFRPLLDLQKKIGGCKFDIDKVYYEAEAMMNLYIASQEKKDTCLATTEAFAEALKPFDPMEVKQ